MKLKLSTLVLASLCAFGAQATTTDWGTHGNLELAATVTPIGAFDDTYMFSLVSPSSLFSTAVSNNLTSVLGIVGGSVSLYETIGAASSLVGSFGFDGTSGSTSHAFGALASGDYFYSVAGVGTGSAGGFYSLTSTVTPVPEPQTYALLLGGLGMVVFLARRRQS